MQIESYNFQTSEITNAKIPFKWLRQKIEILAFLKLFIFISNKLTQKKFFIEIEIRSTQN